MLNKTAYLNGLTKEKELEIFMESHRSNLKQMKSITRNEPEMVPIGINKNKGKYIKNRRDFQIDLENELLTQKIEKIITTSRNSKYFSQSSKYSKSLNGHVKKTTQQKINDENLKMLVRLQESKPTYPTKKYLEEFQHLAKIEKKMSSAEFYLTDSPTFRKRKLNSNQSFLSRRNSSFGDNSSFIMGDKSEIIKQTERLSDGKVWEVRIYKDEKEINITGEVLTKIDGDGAKEGGVKLISIPNGEANLFLRKYCSNRLENLVKCLKVDQKDSSLVLVGAEKVLVGAEKILPSPSKLMNPEEVKNNSKKLNKLEQAPVVQKRPPPRNIFNTANKKPLQIDDLPTFSNHKLLDSPRKQNQTKKSQAVVNNDEHKSILPKIKSKLIETPVKSKENKPISKEEPLVKESKEKLKTKKSSISSIKQNANTKKEAEKNSQVMVVKPTHQQDEEIKKVEETRVQDPKESQVQQQKKEQEQEQQYEQENFQSSINNNNPTTINNNNTAPPHHQPSQTVPLAQEQQQNPTHQPPSQPLDSSTPNHASINNQQSLQNSNQTPVQQTLDKKEVEGEIVIMKEDEEGRFEQQSVRIQEGELRGEGKEKEKGDNNEEVYEGEEVVGEEGK